MRVRYPIWTQAWVLGLVVELMKREFKLNIDKEKFMASGPVLFGCYMQAGIPVGVYEECSDVPRLAALFGRHLSDYNEVNSAKMDLVFFADAG